MIISSALITDRSSAYLAPELKINLRPTLEIGRGRPDYWHSWAESAKIRLHIF
jgi:hypothetical protein